MGLDRRVDNGCFVSCFRVIERKTETERCKKRDWGTTIPTSTSGEIRSSNVHVASISSSGIYCILHPQIDRRAGISCESPDPARSSSVTIFSRSGPAVPAPGLVTQTSVAATPIPIPAKPIPT